MPAAILDIQGRLIQTLWEHQYLTSWGWEPFGMKGRPDQSNIAAEGRFVRWYQTPRSRDKASVYDTQRWECVEITELVCSRRRPVISWDRLVARLRFCAMCSSVNTSMSYRHGGKSQKDFKCVLFTGQPQPDPSPRTTYHDACITTQTWDTGGKSMRMQWTIGLGKNWLFRIWTTIQYNHQKR